MLTHRCRGVWLGILSCGRLRNRRSATMARARALLRAAGGSPSPVSSRPVLAGYADSPGRHPDRCGGSYCTPVKKSEFSLTIFCRGLRPDTRRRSGFSKPGRRSQQRGSHQLRDHVDAVRPAGIPGGITYRNQSGDVMCLAAGW